LWILLGEKFTIQPADRAQPPCAQFVRDPSHMFSDA
jgi:hypothetical protein